MLKRDADGMPEGWQLLTDWDGSHVGDPRYRHTHGVYRQDYDDTNAGALIGMVICALAGCLLGIGIGVLL